MKGVMNPSSGSRAQGLKGTKLGSPPSTLRNDEQAIELHLGVHPREAAN